MSQKTHLQDSNFDWNTQEMLDAYKQAAEIDKFLFGDFDYSYIWKETDTNDVY